MDPLKWRIPQSMSTKVFNMFTLIIYIVGVIYAILL